MNDRWGSDRPVWLRALSLLIPVCAILLMIYGPRLMEARISGEELSLAAENIRRAAVQCYALEGFYPPSLDYLTKHYGVHIDGGRYFIDYQYVASNLMPEITVLPIS